MQIANQTLTYLRAVRYTHKFGTVDDFRTLPRPYFSVAYIESGKVDFESEHGTEHLEAGDIIFIPQGSRYRSFWKGAPETVFFSCHFSFSRMSDTFGNRDFRVTKITDLQHRRADFLFLTEHWNDPTAVLDVLSRFYGICHEFYPQLQQKIILQAEEHIREAVLFIESYYAQTIRIEELAELCHMSCSHFQYCFKKAMGVPPIVYKNSLCISRAAQMLREEPQQSIEEISRRLGFSSSTYFRRLFQSFTGKTPSSFRKSNDPI